MLPQEELIINEDDLSTELKQQHLKFAVAGSKYATASKRTREGKILLAELEAQLRDKIRGQLIAEGQRPTEGILNERLLLEPAYKELRRKVSKLEYEEEEAKHDRDALRMRKDLLLQLCIFLGQEVSNTYERMAKQIEHRRPRANSQ